MSNLSALRKTLKKLGSNTVQFFKPPALRTEKQDVESILADIVGISSRSAQNEFVEALAPDALAPGQDTQRTGAAISSRMNAASTIGTETSAEGNGTAGTYLLDPVAGDVEGGAVLVLYDEWASDTQPAVKARDTTTASGHPKPTASTRAADTTATLTAEQRAVVEAPADERQLVIAGPGTGKTFTVIRRLEYLLGPGGLDVSEILVLSFSRSAVREIRTRLRARVADDDAHGDLDYLQVRTFDSFAYQLLIDVGKTPDRSSDSYDQNILQASREIKEPGSEAQEAISGLRHLIVDELQDLVGPRALLVVNMLKAMSGGFTLLGDPAQAIYDYQARRTSGPPATSFLKWLRRNSEQWRLEERSLTRNLRGSAKCFAISERHRPTILNPDTAHEALGQLRADLRRLPDVGTVSEIDSSLRCLPLGKTAAILCRTNNEALQVHMHLLEQGIPHVLAVNMEDVGLPAWVGRIFSAWMGPDITQAQFALQWAQQIGSRVKVDPNLAWQSLLHTLGGPHRTRRLRMEDLRKALASRPELPGSRSEEQAPITVSTIHRAKGREYDEVIVLDTERAVSRGHRRWTSKVQDAEEARVLYVAATRGRERLRGLRRGTLGRPSSLTTSGRGYVTLPNNDILVEVGIRGDVDDLAGVRRSIFPGASTVEAAQDCLWHMATDAPAPTVTLVREKPGWGYRICMSDGKTILGRMSSAFGSDMMLLSEFLTSNIDTLQDVPIRAVETVVLEKSLDDIHTPYSQSGMCLVIRPQGAILAGKRRD